MNTNERVLSLDLSNISEEDKAWLHKLKNLALCINLAMACKEEGITGIKKASKYPMPQ